MTEKQINKWLRHQFSLVGWVMAGYFAIMLVLTEISIVQMLLSGSLRGMEPSWEDVMGNGWGYILTIAAGILILHSWKGRDYWKKEVFHRENPFSAGKFFACVALMMGVQLLNSFWIAALEGVMNLFDQSLLPLLEAVSGASDTVSMFLYSALLAPIGEEILFRGFALRALRPYGKRFAILGSAFLFGMFHGNLMQTPYAILVGLILGYVTVEYSAWWAVALHMFNNLVLADLFSRLLMLLPEMAANVLDLGVLLAGTVAGLVILIVNRQHIRAWRQGEWMDRRVLKCFFTSPGILIFTILMAVMMVTMF